MAARFWVAGTGTWNGTNTANWAATSGGAPGASVPGTGDDVTFDTLSSATSYTVTLATVTATGLTITFGDPLTGTLTVAGTTALYFYGSLAIGANVNWTCTGAVQSAAMTSGWTINTNNKLLASFTLGGVAGSWTLTSPLNVTGAIACTNGVLNTGNYAMSCSNISIGTTGNGCNFGTSAVTITGSGTILSANVSGGVWDAQLATFTCTYSGASTRTITLRTAMQSGRIVITAGSGNFSFTASGTLTRWNGIDASAATCKLMFTSSSQMGGDLIMNSNGAQMSSGVILTWNVGGALTSNSGIVLHSGTSQWVLNAAVTFTLGDNLTFSGGTSSAQLTLTAGTLDLNAKTLTTLNISVASSASAILAATNATIVLTGTGTVWSAGTSSALTMTGSTIKMTDSSATAKTFAGGGKTYGTVQWDKGAGTSTDSVTAANTYASLKNTGTAAFIIQFPNTTTQTLTTGSGWLLNGTAGNLVSLTSTTAGTKWTLSTPTAVTASYVSIKDSTLTGAGTGNASNSVDAGNNTNWTFVTAGATNGNMLSFF